MIGRLGAIAFTIWLVSAAGVQAAQHTNAAGKYSIWLPDGWTVKVEGNRILAQNPKDTVEAVVGPLTDADADLVDEDVADFVDDELDSMKVVSDTASKRGGLDVRMLEGTGTDGPDTVIFRAVAVDPNAKDAVIEVVVYGDDDVMDKDDVKATVARILNSLKPL